MNISTFGCEVGEKWISKELRNALNPITSQPPLIVPQRQKGITSGTNTQCFANASLCSQTWGGRSIYGWAIDQRFPDTGGCILWCHACWLTPEGKLVDPTSGPHENNSNLFIPFTDDLRINGPYQDFLKDLFFPTVIGELLHMMSEASRRHSITSSTLPTSSRGLPPPFPGGDIHNKNQEEILEMLTQMYGCYLKKLIEIHATDMESYDALSNAFTKTELNNALQPCIREITEQSNPRIGSDCSRAKGVTDITKLVEEGKLLFESNLSGTDFVGSRIELNEDALTNKCQRTGKLIADFPPRQDLLNSQEIPRKKNRRRKIEKIAQKNNLSVTELLLLNNPKYIPHPNLLKRTKGIVPSI